MPDIKDEFEFPDEKEAKGKPEDDNQLDIEIEDDTPPDEHAGKPPIRKRIKEVTDEELDNYSKQAERRIKKFSKGYHDERRAKEQAEREREAAEAYAKQILDENRRLKEQLSSGSKVLIETSKSAAEAELSAAKERYKKAYEAADSDAIVEAQEEIAKATVKLERADTMKPIEHKEEEWDTRARPEPAKPPVPRRTQAWLEANNDWFGSDEEMTMAAMGLDKKLQKEYGAEYVGSKEYFETIDRTMRKRFPEFFEDEDSQSHEDDEPPPKKRAEPADEDYEPPRRASKPASVVAPASRSTPPNRVRLKASEAAIARRLGVPIELYAKQVAQLKRGE
jgi:hypothetical protein